MSKWIGVLLCLFFLLTFCSISFADSSGCTIDPIMKGETMTGATVTNMFGVYCGMVQLQGGGYKVTLEGEFRPTHYTSDYSYQDILKTMCNNCKYKENRNITGYHED